MVAKLRDHLEDVGLGDFPEGSRKRLLGAIPAKYGLEVLGVPQNGELVDMSPGLPFLLQVKRHGLWSQIEGRDGSGTCLRP